MSLVGFAGGEDTSYLEEGYRAGLDPGVDTDTFCDTLLQNVNSVFLQPNLKYMGPEWTWRRWRHTLQTRFETNKDTLPQSGFLWPKL